MSPLTEDDWIQDYYLDPKPTQLVGIFKELVAKQVLSGQIDPVGLKAWWLRRRAKPGSMDGRGGMRDETWVAFLSEIFARLPESVPAWLAELDDLPERHQRTAWIALWVSKVPDAELMIMTRARHTSSQASRFAVQILALTMQSIEQMPLATPAILDMQWGAFFASGAEHYVLRVIEALSLVSAPEGSLSFAIGMSALWSLQVNAKRHAKVRAICERAIREPASEGMQILLKSIVAPIQPQT